MGEPTTDELIERWIQGDRDAAAVLYERYYRRAVRFGMSITKREADAEDIAEEAIAAGLEAVRAGRRPQRFTGWLLGVVKHLAWRRNRRREGDAADELAVIDPQAARPSQVAQCREMGDVLRRALESLDPQERELLQERVLEKAKREDLARQRGCSVDTIDRRLARAMTKLREMLSGHFTTLVFAGRPPTMKEVQALRPSFRETFLMRHVEGLADEDVAARLGIPVETVHERLKHAYRKLGCTATTDFSGLRRPAAP